jgi:hypothetical protein
MRKIIIITGAIISVFLAACADSSEKNASRDYVKAAQKVAKAAKCFDNADYKTALALCLDARSEVEKIVEKYPESAVALKVVTDASTLIGPCKYIEMTDKIVPRLQTFANADMADVELPWIIASSQQSQDLRDRTFFALASKLASDEYSSKLKGKQLEKIMPIILSNIKNPETRSLLTTLLASKTETAKKPETKNAATVKASAVPLKIADKDAFIKQAQTDASLVSFDIRTIDNLKEKAKLARNGDNGLKAQFDKILSQAYDNILKISTPAMREKAMAGIAIAFANFGDDLRAIAISQKITNAELFTAVFYAIADVASGSKNYREALALASRLKSAAERDKFHSDVAISISSNGLFAEAKEVVAKVSSIEAKNRAYTSIAKIALDKGNKEAFADYISMISVKNLDCLSVFDNENTAKLPPHIVTAARLADIAAKMAKINPKLAEALNNLAAAESKKIESGNSSAETVYKRIIRNMASLGKSEEAIAFISNNIHKQSNSNQFIDDLYFIAATSSDREIAKKAFVLAANLCEALGSEEQVKLALALQFGNLDRSESAQILKPFLPKFNQE